MGELDQYTTLLESETFNYTASDVAKAKDDVRAALEDWNKSLARKNPKMTSIAKASIEALERTSKLLGSYSDQELIEKVRRIFDRTRELTPQNSDNIEITRVLLREFPDLLDLYPLLMLKLWGYRIIDTAYYGLARNLNEELSKKAS